MRVVPLKDNVLPLKNGGELSLFFLGTGSAFSKRFNQTNFLVVKGDTHLLVDCGSTASRKLHCMRRSFLDIKYYHITHSHADHIGGIEEAMLSHRYLAPHKSKPKLIISEDYAKFLWEYSLRGGNAYSEVHQGCPLQMEDFWDLLYMKRLDGYERDTWEYQLANLNLKMPRTCHFPSNVSGWKESTWSTGLILDKRVFITSDTRYDPDLIFEYTKRFPIEIIFHDCQLFKGGIHASLEEINQLPMEIKKKMILMHYGDNVHEHLQTIRECGFHSVAMSDVLYLF